MDRYKRSILKKSKIYRPYTLDGIGNFYFSPYTITGIDFSACQVDPSGNVYGGSSYVYYHSYGHLVRSVLQILIKMVVKIAEHGLRRRLPCVASLPFRCRRPRSCRQFLRANDRRACTTPTSAVHGMCGRMVTPTMISMSTIPTGA